MQVIVWQIIIFLLPVALAVAKQFVQTVMAEVAAAETQEMTGTEKKALVLKRIAADIVDIPMWTVNAILECCVSAIKVKA